MLPDTLMLVPEKAARPPPLLPLIVVPAIDVVAATATVSDPAVLPVSVESRNVDAPKLSSTLAAAPELPVNSTRVNELRRAEGALAEFEYTAPPNPVAGLLFGVATATLLLTVESVTLNTPEV